MNKQKNKQKMNITTTNRNEMNKLNTFMLPDFVQAST